MRKSKRVKKSNSWKIKQHRDPFFKKSKTFGYRSRASFKLIELNKKFKFIKKNSNLLDLGSFPGGWSQVVSQIITKGRILSIDIRKMEPVKNVNFLQADIIKSIVSSFLPFALRRLYLDVITATVTFLSSRSFTCSVI